MFNERLITLRNELGLNNKQMSKKLGIGESYYSQIENGRKSPSKNFMEKLVNLSGKPEEFWFYGIEDKNKYIDSRQEFKCTTKAVEQILDLGLDVDELFKKDSDNETIIKSGSIEELIVAALKADIEHIKLKKKEQ